MPQKLRAQQQAYREQEDKGPQDSSCRGRSIGPCPRKRWGYPGFAWAKSVGISTILMGMAVVVNVGLVRPAERRHIPFAGAPAGSGLRRDRSEQLVRRPAPQVELLHVSRRCREAVDARVLTPRVTDRPRRSTRVSLAGSGGWGRNPDSGRHAVPEGGREGCEPSSSPTVLAAVDFVLDWPMPFYTPGLFG